MKKIIGYGVFYLIGLLCVLGMMARVDNLDSNVATENLIESNTYVLN